MSPGSRLYRIALLLGGWLLFFPLISYAQNDSRGIRYLEPSYSREDIDLEQIAASLRRAGVEIPGAVKGKVSFAIRAGIPWNALNDGDAYRLDGSLTSRHLEIGGLMLKDLSAVLRYRNRILSLDPLRFQIHLADAREAPGTFVGKASIDFRQNGRLTAALQFEEIPWGDLLQFFVIEGVDIGGRVSGTAQLTVPVNRMYDSNALQASANLRAGSFTWERFAATGGEIDVSLARGVVDLSHLFLRLDSGSVSGRAQLQLATMQYRANLSLDRFPVATVAKLVDLPAPMTLGGEVSGSAVAEGTISPLTYAMDGKASGKYLRVDDLKGMQADVAFAVTNEKVIVREFTARLLGGSVRGSATADLRANTWEANVALADISLPQIRSALKEQIPYVLEGIVSGKGTGKGRIMPLTYSLAGSLQAEKVKLEAIDDITASTNFAFENRHIQLEPVKVGVFEGTIHGNAEAFLDTGKWKTTLKVEGISLARVGPSLPPALQIAMKGQVAGDADLAGSIAPLSIVGTGTVRGTDFEVQRVHSPCFELVFAAKGDRVELSKLTAELLGGSVVGSATIPLKVEEEWKIQAEATEIDWSDVGRAFIAIPFPMNGRLDARLAGALGPGNELTQRVLRGKADLTSDRFTVNGIAIEKLRGLVTASGEVVDYSLHANALDGRFELEGRAPQWRPVTKESDFSGRVLMERMQLSRLKGLIGPQNLRMAGELDASMAYSHVSNQSFPEGSGRVRLRSFQFADSNVSRELNGELYLRGGTLELRNFGGNAFGGRLRTSVHGDLRQWDRLQFTASLEQGSLASLAQLVPGTLSLPGTLELQMRGQLGREINASGTASVRRTEYQGLQLDSVQIPFELRYAPQTAHGRLSMRQSSVQVAQGRLQGTAAIDWQHTMDVTGDFSYSDLRLDALLKQLIGPTQLVGGRISGTASLRGERIATLAGASLHVHGKLRRTSAQQLPFIGRLLPYVNQLGGSSPVFETGNLNATYQGGRLTIASLELDGSSLRMLVRGEMQASGRLNLNVVASSGPKSLADRALQGIATKFLVAAVPPLAILEANELLKDRVIYLTVTGTYHSPVIRVQPVPTLGAEAIRFFLRGF